MQVLLKNLTDFEEKVRGLIDKIENLEREKEEQCQKSQVFLTTKENSNQRQNSDKVVDYSSDTDQDLYIHTFCADEVAERNRANKLSGKK